ncbi:MAG TPA: DUF2911 domain-containing protein [Chitinophagaceae bacterium]|nr:DUF2911 domain-containing protein [Chitinophagaceae bacterium]
MIKTTKWLPFIFIIAACNNNKSADNSKSDNHADHQMVTAHDYCDSVNKGLIAEDTLKGSPHRSAMNTINNNHVHIEYNSPGVKGRTIWGGLVAYDKVWVTGAHSATSVQFSKDVEINGTKIPAGKYAFFTIPGKEKWTLVLNQNYDQHLADEYSETEDLVRVEVVPTQHDMVQRLTYHVNKIDDTKAEIVVNWEKLQVALPFASL